MNTVSHSTSSQALPAPTGEWHLASLVVYSPADAVKTLTRSLDIRGLEVHAVDPRGKLVVTIEADSAEALMRHIETLRAIPKVLSVQLVYQQSEDDRVQDDETDP